MIVHCMFEQSGTFKNEFKKLGYDAYDYDVKNEFGETDYVIDLYSEIEKAFCYRDSVFDRIGKNDLIMAFFPCIRFEDQIKLRFRGEQYQQKNDSDEKKLLEDMRLHKELHDLYQYVTMLMVVCIRGGYNLLLKILIPPNITLLSIGRSNRR